MLFIHLTEFHLSSITLKNLNIVISKFFAPKNPIYHLHEIQKISILCKWFIGFLEKNILEIKKINLFNVVEFNLNHVR